MSYNEITGYNSPNYTPGRGGNSIKGITIHWWGDPSNNPTDNGVVSWLCNPASGVSAHLVITGTGRRVYQIVNDSDTAWHAGNWSANQTTLGLELDPRARDEDYDVAAEVIADLWKYYGKLPLYPHKHWTNTSCPGVYDLGRLKSLAESKLSPKPVDPPAPQRPKWGPMDNPRSMVAISDLYVKNLITGQNEGKVIPKGQTIGLVEKTDWNGKTYLRTEYSKSKGFDWGIDLSLLGEVPIVNPTPPPENEATGFTDKDRDTLNEINTNTKNIWQLLQKLVEAFMSVFKVGK